MTLSSDSVDPGDTCKPVPKKKTKKRKAVKCLCCSSPVSLVVGECSWCNKKFCSHHRLPESHFCTELQRCKDSAFNINKTLVETTKTASSKVAPI